MGSRFDPDNPGDCFGCSRVLSGTIVFALDRKWHKECFACHQCRVHLAGTTYVSHLGRAYCRRDYEESFCPRCPSCSKPITDNAVNALGESFHPECFKCSKCKNVLSSGFVVKDGVPVCPSCYEGTFAGEADSVAKVDTKSGTACSGCKKELKTGYVSALGKPWHAECFVCAKCKKRFASGASFFQKDGKPYCENDYNNLFGVRCASCNQVLTSKATTALGKKFHMECFKCHECRELLLHGTFYDIGGKPLCAKCKDEKIDRCGGCGQGITTGKCTTVGGKRYHLDCLKCAKCEGPISGNFFKLKSGIFCSKCPPDGEDYSRIQRRQGSMVDIMARMDLGDSPYPNQDRRAINCPESACTSVPALAQYLSEGFDSEYDHARIAFRWIAANIECDVTTYDGRLIIAEPDVEDVLSRRKAISSGFASLFKALCDEMNIECEVVHGWSKAASYRVDDVFFRPGESASGSPNHAWNVVKVDGEWKLVDCTWAAGHVMAPDGIWIRRFCEHYFFTEPEQFVYDHLPTEREWQLMKYPCSQESYEALVYLQPAFFAHGLKLVHHSQGTISVGNVDVPIEICLDGPRDSILAARLRHMDESTTDLADCAIVQRRIGEGVEGQDRFVILVTIPHFSTNPHRKEKLPPKDHILRIFVKKETDASLALESALDYKLDTSSFDFDAIKSRHVQFPQLFQTWQLLGALLMSPVEGNLIVDREYEFRIKVPGASEVAMFEATGSKVCTMSNEGEEYFFSKVTPKMKGTLTVSARMKSSASYQGLLEYTIVHA